MKRLLTPLQRPFRLTDLTLWRWMIALLVVLVMLTAIALLVLDLRQQVQRLAASAADNMQWTLGQAEVELMALQIAALEASTGDGTLEAVRLRYDVFYSRVTTLTQADRFATLNGLDGMSEKTRQITEFRDALLPFIDGPDDALRAALPQLTQSASAIRSVVREATLTGVDHFSRFGDIQRASLAQSLIRLGFLTVALVSLLAVLAFALFHLARRSDAEARENRETRERIETILSTSFDAVLVCDSAGRLIDFNGAAENVFGYSRAEAIGQDMADLVIPTSLREAHRNGMRRYRRFGTQRFIGLGPVRLEACRQDGTQIPVEMSLTRAQSPEGEIFIAFLRDISARVSSEVALKQARDRAIAGEKQKAELLAVMSHEMRTPLNGMLGTLELFEPERLDSRHQRYLRIIRDSGRVLLGHVNDVLDISRLDAGKLTPRRAQFDLVALLEEIIDNQAQRAQSRGNRLSLSPPNPVLHEVYGDPDRLRQILLNLVSNAIKFTSNGNVVIEADCSAGLDDVEIRVTDTGIGIAEDDLDRIFGDFVTIDSSYTRNTSGTGLGLGISQRLASAMNGEMGVESEPGDGSLFWLRLPLSRPAHMPDIVPPEEKHSALPRSPRMDILLVEDNEVNRVVATELLERDGHSVITAADGEIALHRATARAFDLILMDISMPGMDGVEVSRAIRSGGGTNAETPIIATTAHALPSEIQKFRAAGMQTVLIKPLSVDSIRGALSEALNDHEHGVALPVEAASNGVLIDEKHLQEMQKELSATLFGHAHDTFLREMTAFADALPQSIAEGPAALRQISVDAHRMAGSAGVVGAVRLNSILRTIHEAALDGDVSAVSARAGPLSDTWLATRQLLKERTLTAPPTG
ncbi:ATP-binding protein [Antarctobacter jejuensis]|uniref:ATP-binding protein n=1 Tax=Antarctobacter jejuensis TaxID=1439938 RepID=UPI003FD2D45F